MQKNWLRSGVMAVAMVFVAGTAGAQMGGHMGGGAGGMGSDHMQQMHQMQQQMMNDLTHQSHCMTQEMQQHMQNHQCEMIMGGHGTMQRMHAPEGQAVDQPHPAANPKRAAAPQPAPRPRAE